MIERQTAMAKRQSTAAIAEHTCRRPDDGWNCAVGGPLVAAFCHAWNCPDRIRNCRVPRHILPHAMAPAWGRDLPASYLFHCGVA